MICLLLGLLLLLLAYKFWYLPRVKWSRLNVKSTKPLPILGDCFSLVRGKEGLLEFTQRLYEEFSTERFFGMHQFSKPVLIIRDPELVQKVCIKDFDHFTDHSIKVDNDVSFLSNAVFFLNGDEWRSMRKRMAPTFTIRKLKIMYPYLVKTAEQLSDYLMSTDTKNVDLMEIIPRYTNDAMANCVFGLKVDSLHHKDNEIYRVTSEFCKSFRFMLILLSIWPLLVKFVKTKSKVDGMFEMVKNLVKESIEIGEREKMIGRNLIDLLMEARQRDDRITINNVVYQVITFFGAGLEAITSVVGFILYELAINPNIQERLCDEIGDVLQQNDDRLSYDALLKMKYLDMVVAEGLRKYPSGTVTDRKCTKSYKLTSSTFIEENTVIWLPIYAIHRDSRYFPDAERFDPERFSDENKAKIKPGTYLPFGYGPRQCVGILFAILQLKTVLVHLVSKFRIKANSNTQVPLRMQRQSISLCPKDGIWVTIEGRERKD